MFGRAIRSYRFALAAFLISVLIRSVSEILVGPYPIRWDTITYHVPITTDSQGELELVTLRTHVGLKVEKAGLMLGPETV